MAKLLEMLQRLRCQYACWRQGKPPEIRQFYHSELLIAEHGRLHLHWEALHVHRLHLSGVGDVTGRTEIAIKVPLNMHQVTLTAYGGLRKVRQTISLNAAQTGADTLRIGALQVNRPVVKGFAIQHKGSIFLPISGAQQADCLIKMPQPPSAEVLKKLRESVLETIQGEQWRQAKEAQAALNAKDLAKQEHIYQAQFGAQVPPKKSE